MKHMRVLVDHRVDIDIFGNEPINASPMKFFILLMKFIDCARQPH